MRQQLWLIMAPTQKGPKRSALAHYECPREIWGLVVLHPHQKDFPQLSVFCELLPRFGAHIPHSIMELQGSLFSWREGAESPMTAFESGNPLCSKKVLPMLLHLTSDRACPAFCPCLDKV